MQKSKLIFFFFLQALLFNFEALSFDEDFSEPLGTTKAQDFGVKKPKPPIPPYDNTF
jgi:hypothetical protein